MSIDITARILSLLIGYGFGNFLTAEAVTRRITGRPCAELGETGNPGMANVMRSLGFKPGIVVLIGDIVKTALAMLISRLLFMGSIGMAALFYAGLGAVAGHDFPIWQRFRGGKGVACCCTLLILYSPWGLVACIIGMFVVFIWQYLCVGGIIIPAAFILPAFFVYGKEIGILTLILKALCVIRHYPALKSVPSGESPKTDVLGKIRSLINKDK